MKRDAFLEPPDLLAEKLVLHGYLADDRRQPGVLVILRTALARLEGALRPRQEAVAPFGQPVRRNADVAGDGLQALAADEQLDGGGLALHRKPALAPVFGGSGPVGAPTGPEPPPHERSSGLVKTWSFLSVAKASIPSQEIGSHYSCAWSEAPLAAVSSGYVRIFQTGLRRDPVFSMVPSF